MIREDVLAKVEEIAKDVFENSKVKFTELTTAKDVEEWDSLTHLALMSDIEDEFEIKFSLSEISNTKNVGELVSAIIKHIEIK